MKAVKFGCQSIALVCLLSVHLSTGSAKAAEPVKMKFDLPGVAVATSGEAVDGERVIDIDLPLSLIWDQAGSSLTPQSPPIDHLLIRVAMRNSVPVVGYQPKTTYQSELVGPVAITTKHESASSVGINFDGVMHPFRIHGGGDLNDKLSDASEYQQHAPTQAVIAAGTIDRGEAVYYKLRWTRQNVLEGEKRFQVSFAVPSQWRGGVLDVFVQAMSVKENVFGRQGIKALDQQHFVVALFQHGDTEAAEAARALAKLDRRLQASVDLQPTWSGKLAGTLSSVSTPAVKHWLSEWDRQARSEKLYRQLIRSDLDQRAEKFIHRLPPAVQQSVQEYNEAQQELLTLSQ